MYRRTGKALEVLLVHPGGPFWRNKDDGAWSIPKGEIDEGEDPAEAALREFMEEMRPLVAQKRTDAATFRSSEVVRGQVSDPRFRNAILWLLCSQRV